MTLLDPGTLPADLQWGSDAEPGIRRRGRARFRYVDDRTGQAVADAATLARIRSLAVPPAWTDVWIAPEACWHVQATGRDARGRKQYRYHTEFRREQDDAKFELLGSLGRKLPALRRRVEEDLSLPGMPQERVVALVVRLMEETYARVGNEEYARTNRTFGLTTLRDRHARPDGGRLRLRFAGKGGRPHDLTIGDRRLARLVVKCQELPGQTLFQYLDGDEPRPLRSQDVNGYVRETLGDAAGARFFRTWGATVLAASALARSDPPAGATEARRAVTEVVGEVARTIHNTPTVCRTSYIHPAVLDAAREGAFHDRWEALSARGSPWLSPDERRLLRFLDAGS